MALLEFAVTAYAVAVGSCMLELAKGKSKIPIKEYWEFFPSLTSKNYIYMVGFVANF